MIGALAVVATALIWGTAAQAADPVELKFERSQLESRWRTRIEGFLERGVIPLIDMESSLGRDQIDDFIPNVFQTMDDLGVALIAADGYQRPEDGTEGYRWSFYIRALVNAHPDRFVPTANGGTSPNWLKQKGGKPQHFIDQMDRHVRAGVYAHMGELDFRHYMSNRQ